MNYKTIICIGVFTILLTLCFTVCVSDELDGDGYHGQSHRMCEDADFVYQIYDDSAGIEKCKHDQTNLEIPKTVVYNGKEYPITTICSESFAGQASLQNVTIPDHITSIGHYAFVECVNLKSVCIPSSVKTMGDAIFASCANLSDITICEGLETIGTNMFYGSGIRSLVVPDSISSIGEGAFKSCDHLESIQLSNNLTVLEENLFMFSENLREVKLSNGVTNIEKYAFYKCTSLECINLPESLRSIGEYAFAECSSIETLIIPDQVNNLGEAVFSGCGGLTELKLNKKITDIPNFTFSRCKSLSSLTLPEGIKSLGYQSFHDCDSLMFIDFPKSILNLEDAFDYRFEREDRSTIELSDIEEISGHQFEFDLGSFFRVTKCTYTITFDTDGGSNVSPITLIPGKSIPKFEEPTKDGFKFLWWEPEIPRYMPSSDIVFKAIWGEESIHFKDGNLWFKTKSDGSVILTDCEDDFISELHIPEKVNYEGKEYAVTEIGDFIVRSLNSVYIPSSVKTIGEYAFSQCGLKNVYFSEGLEYIDDNAFFISQLKELELPKSLKKVGNEAFRDNNFVSLTVPSGVEFGEGVFCISDELKLLTFEDGIVEIMPGMFSSCGKLETVKLPSSLEKISKYAFDRCVMLEDITLPNSLTMIGEGAFKQCEKLKYLELPEGLTSIECNSFDDCLSLESLHIPASVKNIDSPIAYNCPIVKFSVDENNDSFTFIDNGLYSKDLKIFYGFPGKSTSDTFIREGTEVIKKNSLYNMIGLEFPKLPESTRVIESHPILNGSDGGTFYISKNVESLGTGLAESSIFIHRFLVHPDNPYFSSFNGLLMNKDMTILLECPPMLETVTFPDSIKQISGNAFTSDYGIDTIVLNRNLEIVEENAFKNITAEIYPNENLKYIGNNAFRGCTSLEHLSLKNIITIGDSAFFECSNLCHVELGNSLTKIGKHAFQGCALKEIRIPDSLKIIEKNCFYNQSQPQSVSLGQNTEIIKSGAFGKITVLSINPNLKIIEDRAFKLSIKDLTLPNTLNYFGKIDINWEMIETITIPKKMQDGFHLDENFRLYRENGSPILDPWSMSEFCGFTFYKNDEGKLIRGPISEKSVTFTGAGVQTSVLTGITGSPVDYPDDPVREGYKFIRWDPYTPQIFSGTDLKITAVWECATPSITIDTDGGTHVPYAIVDEKVTIDEIPIKHGYKFVRWNPSLPMAVSNKDITITAVWEVDFHTITFVDTDGVVLGKCTQQACTALSMPEMPIKEGYSIVWLSEVPEEMPNKDMVIEVKWKADNISQEISDNMPFILFLILISGIMVTSVLLISKKRKSD